MKATMVAIAVAIFGAGARLAAAAPSEGQPYDWAAFLHQRVDSAGKPAPLDGLRRGGYRLVYTDSPSDYMSATEDQRKRVNLLFSIGVEIDDKDKVGTVSEVVWDSPAFKAKLTEGDQILAVNGVAYGLGCAQRRDPGGPQHEAAH